MKILMIISGMSSGGAERVMATLCNELSKKHDVRLAILKEPQTDYFLDDSVEITAGYVRDRSFVKSVRFIQKQMTSYLPDVALSFMTKSNLVALAANKLLGNKFPLVIAERGNPYMTTTIFRIMRRIMAPWAQGAVFQTSQAQNFYKKILRCPSVILRNPLNPDFQIPAYTGMRTKRIVSAGRLSREKNHRLLIDAFAEIQNQFPEYRVEIYGDGILKDELQDHINELGLEESVFLMGRRDHIQELIRDAEVFVLPSDSEGLPNALIEAMALGMACVATDCPIGGSAMLIKDGENGLLVPMRDKDALAAALQRLLSDEALAAKLRQNATQVTQDYDTVKVCREWEEYLLQVAAQNKN